MAIDKDSPGFTFGFATVMVVIVAILLAVAALALKPAQDENKKQEKMQAILASVNVICSREEAPAKFDQLVKKRIILNSKGEVLSEETGAINISNSNDAFNVDIKKEYKEKLAKARTVEDMHFPIYVCEQDGKMFYVIPVVGTGLWGPIWGNLALESDLNTVFGATFDHQGETPGLGAEINTDMFESQFKGEKLFDEQGNFVSIKVIKGGADDADKHGVDAITGGTITSVGLDQMVYNSLNTYVPYLKQNKTL